MNAITALALTNEVPGAGWLGSWSPGIGDPTFMGWFTVLAYAGAAILCFRLRSRFSAQSDAVRRKERHYWTGLAVILGFLCLNKQLDLQTAMTEGLRILSVRGGWYARRSQFQIAFIVAMALAVPILSFLLFVFARKLPLAAKLAGLGLVVLGVFVLIRAASFHHVDRLLGSRVLLLKMNWVLELGGIAFVLFFGRRRWRELDSGPHGRR
jgi:putative exporter of polyketide antibiotics